MNAPLEFSELFDPGTEPRSFMPAATLKEEEIPTEGLTRAYTQGVELGKIGQAEFSKAVAGFSWNDEVSAPLEKRARKTVADELGIVRTEIVEENGERIAKAFDAAGILVAERRLY
jgi:hypothetical protein